MSPLNPSHECSTSPSQSPGPLLRRLKSTPIPVTWCSPSSPSLSSPLLPVARPRGPARPRLRVAQLLPPGAAVPEHRPHVAQGSGRRHPGAGREGPGGAPHAAALGEGERGLNWAKIMEGIPCWLRWRGGRREEWGLAVDESCSDDMKAAVIH